MNYTELKEKTDQYVASYIFAPDRSLSATILNGFLWWLYPRMKDEDLPSYREYPLKKIPVPSYPSAAEAELYGIQHPERCPPGDPMCPQQEPDCSLCEDTGVVLDTFEGCVNCPRCG